MPFVRGGYFGGNCNNSQLYGVSASNLNNAPSNANWNIGASHSYEDGDFQVNALIIPQPDG